MGLTLEGEREEDPLNLTLALPRFAGECAMPKGDSVLGAYQRRWTQPKVGENLLTSQEHVFL